MQKTISKIGLAILLGAIPFSTASAFTITTDPGDWTGYLSGPGQLIYDFDTLTPVGADLTGNYTIFNTPSGTSQSAPPAGSSPGNNYLSVPNPSSSGSAMLSFNQDMDYLGLFWGSVDTYNSIEFFNDGSTTGVTIFGLDVAPPASGDQVVPGQNLYVHISDIPVFDAIQLTSTQFAFELDNIAAAPVPEPSTMVLIGAGLAGFIGVSRRKKN